MAITLGANDTIVVNASSTTTSVSTSHVINTGTTLLMLTIHLSADKGLSVEPFFNTSEAFTLIDQTTSSAAATDVTVFTYGLVNPTDTTANITFTVDSTDHVHAFANNWLGTETASVAAATNFLSEDVNDSTGETNTSVHSSGGTSGRTLYFSAAYRGGDGRLGSNDAGFTEQRDARTGTSNVVDVSYIVADLIGGAPSAITHTWAATDSNASHLIELIPAVSASAPTGNIAGPLAGPMAGVV